MTVAPVPAAPKVRGGPLRLAVTLGDPRGIGPEVMLRALSSLDEVPEGLHLTLLGAEVPEGPAGSFPGSGMPGLEVAFVETGNFDGSEASAGVVSAAALEEGVRLALSGAVEGVVTGPVSKPALHAAGLRVPGQTEFFQLRSGAPEVGMLMASEGATQRPPLRILLITTHLALRDVPAALTRERVEGQLRLLDISLRSGWGIASPRIALCALNPHASDGGLFGDEEARVLEPAVASLRGSGVDVEGPFPADTVFQRLLRGSADAVAVPYHDVGMAVFKTLSFGAGVNVTLGLPFVRTSPDHGTAFDRAGTGTADPSSAVQAFELALRLCRGGRSGPRSGNR
jgi:4-hydroxythreonine-4-phosphate dehydrogenase